MGHECITMTRGAIKIRENGEELRLFYGHDAGPESLGIELRRYLNMTNHKWSAMRIYKDLCDGKCLCGTFGDITGDTDFEPTKELGYYEEYGYLIDCDKKKLTCYDLPGIPAGPHAPDGNTSFDDWSGRTEIKLPYIAVSEDVTTERIKYAVADYLFSREVPKPFGTCLAVGNWTVAIEVEEDRST